MPPESGAPQVDVDHVLRRIRNGQRVTAVEGAAVGAEVARLRAVEDELRAAAIDELTRMDEELGLHDAAPRLVDGHQAPQESDGGVADACTC